MAIATVELTHPTPRSTPAASAIRVPPRVYSPFGARRLARPMATRAGEERVSAAGGRARFPALRLLRGNTLRDRSA